MNKILISGNTWHKKLVDYTFNKRVNIQYFECYFWVVTFCVITSPIVWLIKGFCVNE